MQDNRLIYIPFQMKNYPELSFVCPEDQLTRLATVLQSGFHVCCSQGESILSLLRKIPGFTETYIVDEIQTVFLNGDALDDLETPLSGPAATIALAGAMPGLAGAIVRKGSPWGALRKTKTVQNKDHSGKQVHVLVKLFNTVAVDRGADLITHSVRINTRDLVHFLDLRPSLLNSFKNITLDGNPVAAAALADAVSSYDLIKMKGSRL